MEFFVKKTTVGLPAFSNFFSVFGNMLSSIVLFVPFTTPGLRLPDLF